MLTTMSIVSPRQSAEERREAVLAVATEEFARKGLHGASTERIARAAGISQPYLFRLFRTKKELYLETAQRRMEETYLAFERVSRGLDGEDVLRAMGEVYTELIADPMRLQLMLQCFADCDEPEVRVAVRRAWRDLVELVERRSGEPPEVVSAFFARGMLLNALNAMQLFDDPTDWGDRLIGGCRTEPQE
jgi:AcrR family transcriptional regulator